MLALLRVAARGARAPAHCTALPTAPFCALNLQLLTPVDSCGENWNFPAAVLLWESLCRRWLRRLCSTFLTEKTLQFRLMWEGVRQAFSSPLSAVSAWNRAACVGSMRYLHTRIWNLNDSNITLSTGRSSLCRGRKVFLNFPQLSCSVL